MVNLGSIMGNPSLSSYYGKFSWRREIAIEWTTRGEGMPGMYEMNEGELGKAQINICSGENKLSRGWKAGRESA